MGLKRFDRKFGAQWLRELPAEPAVYLFKDAAGRVLYAGKAKNIRRRLQGYRSASRRKAHRKMRTLVREASELEVRLVATERDALLAENELIRELRPPYNVDGAYTFLYPAIGLGRDDGRSLLCFTTRVEHFARLGLRWHGVFRSRRRALEAFDALSALLVRVGHREPRSRTRGLPRLRGSRILAFRRAEEWLPGLERWLAGESAEVLEALAERLLDKPDARRDAERVGEDLRLLQAFYERDTRRLHEALRSAGRPGRFVSQRERDALFIATRDAAHPAPRRPLRS